MKHKISNYYIGLDLDQEKLKYFEKVHEAVNIDKNTLMVRTGSISNYYWIIEEGLMRSYVISPEGEEITTGFYEQGQIALEFSSFFLQKESVENLVCVSNSKALRISKEAFFELFNQELALQEWGRNWMVEFLINRQNYFLSNHTQDAKERYEQLIRNNPSILRYASLKTIASYLGITDSTLSRIRKEMR